MKYVLFVLMLVPLCPGQTLSVVHRKTLWWDGRGQVEITSEGINYTAEDPKDSRSWRYLDIQYFDRISETEFIVLTYEDEKRYMGRDRQYRFRITDGELPSETFRDISARLGRPVTNRVLSVTAEAIYAVPVKHLHTFGGCEGELRFTEDAVYYVTDHAEDNREWLFARDVQSVWSANLYQLEIHVFDNNRRQSSRTGVYRFDLKQALDASFYRSLKLQLYDLETTHLVTR